MKVRRVLVITISLFVVSICLSITASHASQLATQAEDKLSSELIEAARALEPDDRLLVWIDINATVNCFGHKYLPADPRLYAIKWVTITFAPDMNESKLFWCLAEIQAQDVEEIVRIPWVFNVTVVRVGGLSDQCSNNTKLSPGFQEVMCRAREYYGTLDVIVWMHNSSVSSENLGVDGEGIGNEIFHNVTATIEQGGGRLLRDYYEGSCTLSAALPPGSIARIAKNPFVKKLLPNGPVISDGFDNTPHLCYLSKTNNSFCICQFGLVVLFSPITFISFFTLDKKTRKKIFAFLTVAMILLLTFVSYKIPCVQALNVSTSAIRATDVWATGNRGQGVNVAVLDTGFDVNHNDIAPAIVHCINADDWSNNVGGREKHGTCNAGIVAGRGINNDIYRGVAWGAGLILVKVAYNSDYEPAIRWVIDHANIYNIRVLTASIGLSNVPAGGDGLESPASIAMDDAVELNIVAIKSAGTGSNPRTITSPGNAFNIITVGGTNDNNTPDISDDTFHTSSARGPTGDGRPKPDVVAPSVLICSANASTQGYMNQSGTSMAAPHVAGTVALMFHANPDLTPAQVKAILRQTANLTDNLAQYTANDRGHGIIDAYAAVQLAQNVSNIDINHMYDSWDVETPHRDLGLWCYDYLTFTVAPPSSTFSISMRDVQYHYRHPLGIGNTDYKLIFRTSAQHVWIDDTYYHLGNDMHKYLLSGPRIYCKADYGAVFMRAWFKVGNKQITYDWFMGVDRVKPSLWILGGSQWKALMYIDTDVWDVTNYPYLPSTDETNLIETKITGDVNLTIRDLDHTEYVQIDPPPEVFNPTMWILRHGYFGNDPDATAVKNDEYVYNRDISIFYQQTSQNPGINIYRKGDSLPSPDNTQNDAGTGGDAGNSFNTATSISPWSYKGILCNSDPTDTDDWYQFYAESGKIISLSMTPPYLIDFDLQLYDPSGNLKTGSYNGPGYSDGIAYTADSSGNWRARIYISSGEAQYFFSVSVYSGGGCPFVYAWNGTHYVIDNNLLAASAWSNGEEVGDYYKLEQRLVPTYKGDHYSLYSLRLAEFQQEHSYLDQAKLIAVDHDANVNVAVSPFGEILTYQNPDAPISAADDQGYNQMEAIQSIDTSYYEGYNGSYLLLNFGEVTAENAKLIMRADRPPVKTSIHIQVLNSTENWVDVVAIIPRTYWATEIIDLSTYLPSTGEFKVRLYFTDSHKVDYVGLDTTSQAQIDVQDARLILAYHSDDGVVTTKLRTDDDVYAELVPEQQITLLFAATTQNAEQRTFIIYVKGYYITLDN